MTTQLITPPAALAVSLALAKANLRVDTSDDDTLIAAWINGISAHAEHYMQRSIINQTWRVTLDSFPDAVKLCYPPISAVSFVKYYDADDVLQTLDPTDYIVDTASEPGYVVPAPNKAWPNTYGKINAVQVQYVAGYGTDDTATPNDIKLYILAKLSEQFDPDSKPSSITSSFIDRLLDRHKIWGMG
jgi:uncharacterized phiE125 gp8 family phage protein